MKNLKIYIIIIAAMLVSCGAGEELPPKGLIPEDKMVEVIAEIELTQALIKLKLSNQDTINKQQLFDQVYAEFNISEEQFNSSLIYYSQVPRDLMLIYEDVIIKLSEKQGAAK